MGSTPVVRGGRGARDETAAEALGLTSPALTGTPVVIVVPWERKAQRRQGIVVRRRRRLVHHSSVDGLPVTRVEHTVLDLASEARSVRAAVGWITRAYRIGVTAENLERALNARVRLRRRRLLMALIASVPEDAESPLEVEYHRWVEQAHGLPTGRRQVQDRVGGRNIRRDVDYDEYGVVVELDGKLGHDDVDDRFRDLDRDNSSTVMGRSTLRYGSADVFGSACAAARQVATLLTRRGWTGSLRPCGPNCTALG